MVLGIDISTSITGFAILDKDGELVYSESIDLRKYKTIFRKSVEIKEKILDIFEEFVVDNYHEDIVDHIYIEQSLHMFMRGKSSAKTLSTLTRFNGIVSWLIYELFEIEPEYIGATSARKHAGIRVPRGQKAKEVVMKFLLDNEPKFVIEYTTQGNPKPEAFDRADALVVAKAGYSIEQARSKEDTT
jgi:Holliday junction resolvasome RuvABC endonuclease subunit